MCGIAGELRFRESSVQVDWDKISSMMARRGPNDSGMWSDDERCTLVFRRLAILDLSVRGHQPMTACNGRYVLVYNGESYNFADLRSRLESRGIRFRSNGDTEVILFALIEWGTEALNLINGMFALAFYDAIEKRLLLARDHAGIKPLYYLIRPQGVAFASQYDQLLAHPWSQNLSVSKEALGLYLRLAFIPAPFAVLKGSHMLEPGTWVEFTAEGKMRQGKYFVFPRQETPSLRGDEAIEAVDAVITEAVKRQLVSDVPVGGFLSGGIDSPLVMAKMHSLSKNAVHAFTIGTKGDVTDESTDAIRYAKEIGVKQTVEHIPHDQALSMLDDVIDSCGEPFGDYSIFPTMMVSHLASREFKVMLSGDGGDELFWGYPRRFSRPLNVANDFRSPYWCRKLRWGLKKIFGIGNGLPHLSQHSLGSWHRAVHTHLPELWLKRIFPDLPPWPRTYGAFDYSGWDIDETAQWLRWNEIVCHLTMVLLKVDRASMYHSLEVRVPLLDREVIAVAAEVDWRSCLDVVDMVGKLPLRQALARHVKSQTKAKRGFEVPMGVWLRTSLKPIFEKLVLGSDDILGMKLDRKALRTLFDMHVNGIHNYAWGLWPLLSLALWADRKYNSLGSAGE